MYLIVIMGHLFFQFSIQTYAVGTHYKHLSIIFIFYFSWDHRAHSGPEVKKLFSCSTQLSMKFDPIINLKLLTIANSFLQNIAEHENFSAN